MGPHSWEWCIHQVPWTFYRTMRKSGFYIGGPSFLGASPYGIIEMDGKCHKIIKMKCPYSFRDSSVEEACGKGGFYFTLEDGMLCWREIISTIIRFKGHQGTMAIAGAVECDFVVWIPKSIKKETILFDKVLWENKMLPTLCLQVHVFLFSLLI